jgi:hypothetical protein
MDERPEHLLEAAPVGRGERREEALLRLPRCLRSPVQHAATGGGRVERVCPPVAGVSPALDEAGALELVHHRHHRRAVDPLPLAEALLRQRTLLHEQDERPEPLRAQPERREGRLRDGPVLEVRTAEQVTQLISYTDVQSC